VAKSKSLTALAYLQSPGECAPTSVCVLSGGDAFLKREATRQIRTAVLGLGEDDAISLTVLRGGDIEPRDVFDALNALSLFGGDKRMVIVESADDFVSSHRPLLEDYAERPAQDAVLLLDVKKWPSNTRLAKRLAADKALVVDCAPPDPDGRMNATDRRRVREWLVRWAADRYRLHLPPAVADVMLELVSLAPGLLDQELAKLVGLVGDDQTVTTELVRDNVGSWRTRTTWEMIDAAVGGDAPAALAQLDRLLAAGEAPQAIFPMLAATLRRFAMAGRLVASGERTGRRVPLRSALEDAGVMRFKLEMAADQLRQLGRARADQLRQWLLDADLAMKGSHSGGERPRVVLEQLIARLAKS
jgi:DNA polymerase-3 subunit delta